MPKNHDNASEQKKMKWWVKWGMIAGIGASIATIAMAMPTIGQYTNHVQAVWNSPLQVQRIEVLESNQTHQQFEMQSMKQNVQDIHQDVHEIKLFLMTGGKKPIAAMMRTNSIE